MDFTSSPALALIAVLAFGLGAILASVVMQQKSSREFENLIPAAVALALPGLGQAALIVDAADRILQANDQARTIGLAQEGRVSNKRIRSLGLKARADKPGSQPRVKFISWQYGKNDYEIQVQALHLGRGQVLILAQDLTATIQLDQTRRDFVANISHELKTPIGSITLLVDAIQAAINEPEQLKKFLNSLGVEAERLSLLVQDIIQLSKVQAKDVLAEAKEVKLAFAIADAIDQTSTLAKKKNIAIKSQVKKDAVVSGNPEMLTALFKNLLENALHYSPEDAKVVVKCKQKGKMIEVSITDTGVGIPKSEQERIFERFYRVDPSRSRATGGTGLGLSIAKHIVNQHGGEISVKSKEGKGSTFTVSLPAKQAEQGRQE